MAVIRTPTLRPGIPENGPAGYRPSLHLRSAL